MGGCIERSGGGWMDATEIERWQIVYRMESQAIRNSGRQEPITDTDLRRRRMWHCACHSGCDVTDQYLYIQGERHGYYTGCFKNTL